MAAFRFSRILLTLTFSIVLCAGCTIITQPDRSKIDNNSDDDSSTAGQGGSSNDDSNAEADGTGGSDG